MRGSESLGMCAIVTSFVFSCASIRSTQNDHDTSAARAQQKRTPPPRSPHIVQLPIEKTASKQSSGSESCPRSVCDVVRGLVLERGSGTPLFGVVVIAKYGPGPVNSMFTVEDGRIEINMHGNQMLTLFYLEKSYDVQIPVSCDIGTIYLD